MAISACLLEVCVGIKYSRQCQGFCLMVASTRNECGVIAIQWNSLFLCTSVHTVRSIRTWFACSFPRCTSTRKHKEGIATFTPPQPRITAQLARIDVQKLKDHRGSTNTAGCYANPIPAVRIGRLLHAPRCSNWAQAIVIVHMILEESVHYHCHLLERLLGVHCFSCFFCTLYLQMHTASWASSCLSSTSTWIRSWFSNHYFAKAHTLLKLFTIHTLLLKYHHILQATHGWWCYTQILLVHSLFSSSTLIA